MLRLSIRRLVAAVAIVTVATSTLATAASAHDPIFLDNAQTTPDTGPYMPDGTISWALYGSVLDAGDTRGFEFDLRAGDELFISLLIPNLSPEVDLAEAELPTIELEAPDGTVTTITATMREVFDEPFSRTSYVTLAELREPGQAGRYRGVVAGNAPSRFSVAIGEEEIFFTDTERSGDRPSSFAEIAAPLQAWYSTPPGGEPVELAEGEGEIDMELLEEAMEDGDATAPEGALEDTAPEGAPEDTAAETEDAATEESAAETEDTATEDDNAEAALATADDGEGSGNGWVAPALIAVLVAAGGGFLALQRRGRTA